MLNIMYFMLHHFKMQGEAKNCKKTAFLRALRAIARTARMRSKNGQRGHVGIAILAAHTKFRQNPSIFASP